jgi:hypothetical protein
MTTLMMAMTILQTRTRREHSVGSSIKAYRRSVAVKRLTRGSH